ncbi:hypothetical protein TTHT_1274 [Thermotomaculum hydrothermale]|uniref:Lipoprotein n=1 Tax=Thermotomaculum hydrothermale TaxID=981385 RepID=A0A7R6SYP6_9BACT|nr:hypothetical protein [Thermotomaculum hydrothermale]BBB32791.1 hypothetical protein TTHT_1274 [Thermotomaculum hydrothermale]
MKRFFSLLLVFTLTIFMLACGGKKETKKAEPQKPQVNQQEIAQKVKAMLDLKAQFDQLKTQKEKDDLVQKLYNSAREILNLDPNNADANSVMDFVQLYYAKGWMERGKYSKAKEMVENVLEFSPNNEDAKKLLEKINDWEFLTKDEFKKIKRKMTFEEVQALIGYPLEKVEQKDKYGRTVIAWVYREPELKRKVVLYFNDNGVLISKYWPKNKTTKKKK